MATKEYVGTFTYVDDDGNETELYPTVKTDDTLSIEGTPADAAAVGVAMDNLQESMDDLKGAMLTELSRVESFENSAVIPNTFQGNALIESIKGDTCQEESGVSLVNLCDSSLSNTICTGTRTHYTDGWIHFFFDYEDLYVNYNMFRVKKSAEIKPSTYYTVVIEYKNKKNIVKQTNLPNSAYTVESTKNSAQIIGVALNDVLPENEDNGIYIYTAESNASGGSFLIPIIAYSGIGIACSIDLRISIFEGADVVKPNNFTYTSYGALINLFNPNSVGYTDGGFSVDSDGWITAAYDNTNGTSPKTISYLPKASSEIKANTDYTMVLEVKDVVNANAYTSIDIGNIGSAYKLKTQINSISWSDGGVWFTGGKFAYTFKSAADLSESLYLIGTSFTVGPKNNSSLKYRVSIFEGTDVYTNDDDSANPVSSNFTYIPFVSNVSYVSVGSNGSITVKTDESTIVISLDEPLKADGDVRDEICVRDGKYGVLRRIDDDYSVLSTPTFKAFDDQTPFYNLIASEGSTNISFEGENSNLNVSVSVRVPICKDGAIELTTYANSKKNGIGLDNCFQSVSDGKTAVATALTNEGVATANDAAFETMAANVTAVATHKYNAGVSDTKVGTATASQVLYGKTFTNKTSVGLTGTMTNNGSWIGTTGTTPEHVMIPEGYHNGNGYVDTENVYNETYNYAYSKGYTAGTDDGYDTAKVGTATASQVLSGYTFTNSSGVGLSGSMPNQGAWTSGSSGSGTITIPAGYHNGSGYVDCSGAYNAGVTAGKNTVTYKTNEYVYVGIGAGAEYSMTIPVAGTYRVYAAHLCYNDTPTGVLYVNGSEWQRWVSGIQDNSSFTGPKYFDRSCNAGDVIKFSTGGSVHASAFLVQKIS